MSVGQVARPRLREARQVEGFDSHEGNDDATGAQATKSSAPPRAALTPLGWPYVPVGQLNTCSPRDAVEVYKIVGIATIPIQPKSKKPTGRWAARLSSGGFKPDEFADGGNIAAALGAHSRGLVDIDIDSDDPAVARFVDLFLPPTVTFGRAGRPRSHRLYIAPGAPNREQLWLEAASTGGAAGGANAKREAIEIRGGGNHFTVFPPSTHPSGEAIRFDVDCDRVAEVSPGELRTAVGKAVAATILSRAWPDHGDRHEARLALAGGLLDGGWSEEQARDFLRVFAEAVGDDVTDLLKAVGTSAEREVRIGWTRLAELLRPHRTKLGETDGQQAVKLVREALFPGQRGEATAGADVDSSYLAEHDGMYLRRGRGKNSGRLRLANFTARIVADVATDDGAEVKRVFEVEARHGERVARFPVAAERFAGLGWVTETLGGDCIVYAGHGIKDHARVAIQELSQGAIATRTEYRHTGWREVNGEWVYLHGGGAIGKGGHVEGVSVSLQHPLAPFVIPPARDGEHLKAAVRAAWALVDVLKSDLVTLAAQGAVWRSVLPLACTFGLYIAGRTGVFKSEVAAIAQQHFGAGFTKENLPANFSSTANSLEALAFYAKDALLVVDDFAPGGSEVDVRRYYALFDRLYRAQGNGAGRGRSTPDGRLQVPKPPRGLILGTGEDVPPRHSSLARAFVVEVEFGMIDGADLRSAQEQAREGVFATAMGGFLSWLARQYERVRRGAERRVVELRTKATGDAQHRRTPDTVAQLALAWELFGEFARDVGAVTDDENTERQERVWLVLVEGAKGQAAHHAAADPTVLYVELIKSALISGTAHVADVRTGLAPREDFASACGWRRLGTFVEPPAWSCQGQRIGWVDQQTGELLLDPGAAYKVATEMGRSGGKSLPSDRTLRRRLKEQGVLKATGSDARETVTVRRRVEGVRREVLVLDLSKAFDLDAGALGGPPAEGGHHDDGGMPF